MAAKRKKICIVVNGSKLQIKINMQSFNVHTLFNCFCQLLTLYFVFCLPAGLADLSLEREIEGLPVDALCIACCPNEDMVVTNIHDVFILDSNGKSKAKLESMETEPNKQMEVITGVAVSPLGYILIVGMKGVWVFNLQGKYLHCFDTLTPDDDPNTRVELECIAADREGQVLVGVYERDIITIHTCPKGKVIRKVKCIIGCDTSMVVNSKNQILLHFRLSDSMYSKVVAIDYSGNEVFSFTPRIDEDVTGNGVWPGGILCDDEDNIYIAMSEALSENTGHIHKYSPTGGFLQCIAQGFYRPWDLSFSPDGSLMIANDKSILKFTRK